MTLAGSARHGGGSCQISLSYDNGHTFKVIESVIGDCPLLSQYNFKIPKDAVNGEALLAWTWFNLVGNREMYMNCAKIEIDGASGEANSFTSLYPDLFIANINKGCATVEGQQTVFPNPGKNVIYGTGITADMPAFPRC
jgi:hypothetical protein